MENNRCRKSKGCPQFKLVPNPDVSLFPVVYYTVQYSVLVGDFSEVRW
jgi:hypothetical protein